MLSKETINTKKHDMFIEITEIIQKAVIKHQVKEGVAYVYCPHTTAGITINEHADPDVVSDMIRRFDEIFPWELEKDRHLEGNTAAHMKASTVGASQTILISNGKLLLGTWQGIYFCEFDGPRNRQYYIKLIRT
ncbi:secondary thiamine-phosphate synthase enzyme YjbQ [Niallia sp. 01092]|uniref:secondary thiamine-phosphate synthase enzyme YjbQ n=1 Tax=unclassified Niallia TaxID=2837522 RepID=UPI003FD27EBB